MQIATKMIKSRSQTVEEEFWDCREDSLSDASADADADADDESIRNRHSSTSGYSGSESDELQPDLQDFAFEELGETAEVSWNGGTADFYGADRCYNISPKR